MMTSIGSQMSMAARHGKTAYSFYEKADSTREVIEFISKFATTGAIDPLMATQLAIEVLTSKRAGKAVSLVKRQFDVKGLENFWDKVKMFQRFDKFDDVAGLVEESRVASYWSKRFGKTVEFLPHGDNIGDLLINGVRHEVYSPISGNFGTIAKELLDKRKQGDRLILNLSRSKVEGMTEAQVRAELNRNIQGPLRDRIDIILKEDIDMELGESIS